MVDGINSSVGSSAYVKGSQLGSGSSARAKPADDDKSSAPASFVRETETASAKPPVEDTRQAAPDRDKPDNDNTELQDRNQPSTLQNEQTRGSLLDIAV